MTGIARRRWTALAALGLAGAIAVAGCGTGTPPPSGTPTPTGRTPTAASSVATRPSATTSPGAGLGTSATPTPPPTDPATVLGADGIGPYLVGATLTDLQTRGQVSGVADSTACAGTTAAAPTGGYADLLALSFSGGQLVSVRTTSNTLVTPSGAKVGMSLADAQSLYGGRAKVITTPSGSKALVIAVIATTYALVLYLDAGNNTVTAMSGGDANRLESALRSGSTC
jgi:hypothetical protein